MYLWFLVLFLGVLGDFGSAADGPYNKNWQGGQLFPTVATTHLAFSHKFPTSASRPPTSFDDMEAKLDVWAHLRRKYRHSVDSNLGKILAENHVSFEFKFQTMIGTQVVLLSSPTHSF